METLIRPVPLDEVIISDELNRRIPAQPDYLKEKLAVYDLASRMVDHPDELLPRFVDIAMELTGGISAGLSLYEEAPGPGVFRWRHLRGTLASFDGATTPRNFSPCGVTLDANAPVLALHAERYYDWISAADIVVPEVLLVPLRRRDGTPFGTLWIVSEEVGHFDGGHARAMTELASFIAMALRMADGEEQLKRALAEQETLAREMSHRLKNLLAITQGMIRITAKGSETPDEMADTLIGRLQALSRANILVRRHPSAGPAAAVSDLGDLIRTIILPHDDTPPGDASRFSVCGPPIRCGEHAVNGIALVFHELATNAVKYGGLALPAGRIKIAWHLEDETVHLQWIERGGPPVDGPPTSHGFGTALVDRTVIGQLGGELNHDWQRDGLVVTLALPMDRLSD
ncbi:MAG: histidine kinase [Rubritepida sp.]|nr:histidine kinase [Rubritepida sp.]